MTLSKYTQLNYASSLILALIAYFFQHMTSEIGFNFFKYIYFIIYYYMFYIYVFFLNLYF